MTWHDDRPPTVDEVPDDGRAFAVRQSGKEEVHSGQFIRERWKQPMKYDAVIAWYDPPESYQPPRMPQPGQWWETRDGCKAFVGAKGDEVCTSGQLVGWRQDSLGCVNVCSWRSDGRYYDDNSESDHDLVRPLSDDTTWDTP